MTRSPPLVVHVIHRLAIGGLENGLVNLVNRLPAHSYRHAIVCLTDFTDFRDRIVRSDVEVVALNKAPGNSLRLHARLYALFRRLRPTIVHTRNLAAIESHAAARLAGVPIRIHGEHGWDASGGTERASRDALIRRAFSPLVDRYVALSAEIEAYLHTRIRVPADRITRICNGVDCDRFQPATAGERRIAHEHFGSGAHVVVGTVGRFGAVKNQPLLASAFALALRKAPSLAARLRLVIVGDGPTRADIDTVLAEARARRLAWLPGERDDIPAMLRSFDLFVLPSNAEGICNSLLEAMASGLPAIATRVGGNPELVVDGATGRLVPPGDAEAIADAIIAYADDPAMRRAHGVAARERTVAEFSIDRMVDRYAELYRKEIARLEPRLGLTATHAAGGH